MIRAYVARRRAAPFEAFEYDPGPLAPDAVEIAVESCGLCHSDMSLHEDEWGITQYPFVGGHEVVGRITQAGEAVTHVKLGDRVGAGWFSRSCLTCRTCLSGDQNMCPEAEMTAVGRFGGFADKVRVQAVWATPLPDGVDLAGAGPLFCGGITVFNPLVQFDVRPTDRVGVIGVGGLGHLALKFLNAWGCEVTAFTSTGAKAEEARAFGAHRVVDSRDASALKAEAGRFDLILSTVAADMDWSAYIAALGPRGRLHSVGVPPSPVGGHIFPLIAGQKSISGSPLGAPATTRAMLDFCARHAIAPQIEVMAMSQINDAFEHLKAGRARYRIVLENDFD